MSKFVIPALFWGFILLIAAVLATLVLAIIQDYGALVIGIQAFTCSCLLGIFLYMILGKEEVE